MRWLILHRNTLLLILGLLTAVMAAGVFLLRINFSFESFYPKEDPEFKYYQEFSENFTEEQNYIIYLAVKSPSADIFDASFLQRSDQLFQEIKKLEGIDSVLSALQMVQVRRRGVSFKQTPYLEFESEEMLDRSKQRNQKDSTLIGTFITRDRQSICAYLFTDPAIFDKPARDDMNRALEATLDESGLKYQLSGIPHIRTKYVETIAQELGLFIGLSLVLITTVLFLTYRSRWGILLPQIAVVASLIWILGFMGLTGQGIDLISNLLIPIMFVVGTSDVIHLMTKYLSEVRSGKSVGDAMDITLREIGLSLFLTSVTTAVGFASLIISRIPPIRNFGLYAAAGVLFTFIITIIILPNALLRIPPEHFSRARSVESGKFWKPFMDGIFRLTQKRSGLIVACFTVVLGACIWLVLKIPMDTHLIEDVGKNDPIRKSMEFFEDQSFGLRPFEIGIHMKQDSIPITDYRVLQEIDKFQNFLNEQEKFSPFLSPASLVKQANYIYKGSRARHLKIPDKQESVDELLGFIELDENSRTLLQKVISEDGTVARMSTTCADLGTDRFSEIYENVDQFYRTECDTSLFYYRYTGHAYLTEHNLQYVRSSLLGGLSIAFVVVGFIMGLLFRSWRMLLISMFPNVIPLLLTGGVMGLFGITLTASTALVFVIAFGIAVDDTIHFLTRYKLERQKGLTKSQAIRNTIYGTGKAMILTSLILMGGFVLLLASDFGGTLNTGLFTALTIVFALFADLLLLPILLKYFGK
ncbi:MAG: efflux RND transporter permease subunit [Bacteroidota bacterium]